MKCFFQQQQKKWEKIGCSTVKTMCIDNALNKTTNFILWTGFSHKIFAFKCALQNANLSEKNLQGFSRLMLFTLVFVMFIDSIFRVPCFWCHLLRIVYIFIQWISLSRHWTDSNTPIYKQTNRQTREKKKETNIFRRRWRKCVVVVTYLRVS